MLLLRLAIFLHHVLYFSGHCLLNRAGDWTLIVQSRIDQRFPGFRERGEGGDQIGVVQAAVGAHAFGQCESQTHQQMFVLVEKLVFDLHLYEEVGRIQVSHAAWFLVLAGLLQIHAITGTVERHLALLATTLRTDAAMNGRAETLLLALFADRTAHRGRAPITIMTSAR